MYIYIYISFVKTVMPYIGKYNANRLRYIND